MNQDSFPNTLVETLGAWVTEKRGTQLYPSDAIYSILDFRLVGNGDLFIHSKGFT